MNAKRTLATFIVILGLAGAGMGLAAHRPIVDSGSSPAKQLPREWVWEKQAIKFDDMYRRAPAAEGSARRRGA